MKDMLNSLRKTLNNKNMKYGSNATILTVAFIAIIIVINLIVGSLVQKFTLKADLTGNKMFSFSDQTLNTLKSINQPINIYMLYSQGQEDKVIQEILQRYAAKSSYIKIEMVDPVKNPAFANKYNKEGSGIQKGSIIFESGDKYKVVSSYDLYNYNYQKQSIDSISAEQRFTSAILYVTSDKIPTIYMTQGHGEANLYSAKGLLEKENYKVDSVSLINADIPEDAEVIMIASPQRDFSAEEIEKLDAYCDRGGSVILLADVGTELPKLEAYIKEWGMELQNDMVIEGDRNSFFQYPNYIFPKIQSHAITSKFVSDDLFMLTPVARSIDILFEDQDGIKVTSLLKSSDNSWGKVNLQTQTAEKQPEDNEGPLNIAAVAVKTVSNGEKEAKMLVIGTSSLLSDDIISQPSFANSDFFMNSINWMQGKEENISIRPKSIKYDQLPITQLQAIIYSLIVFILIPLLVFILGGFVWLRRKHL